MYQPPLFRQEDRERIHAVMRAHPFGLLITSGASGLLANGIPFFFDPAIGMHGVLRGHLARANGQWKDCGPEGIDALVVFQGADSYVRPGWYETKRETGKVVPTWNYVMVQARGRARAIEDEAWMRTQITDVTAHMERPRDAPWAPGDAPEDFLRAQIKGIVGIEIMLTDLVGKWKTSQNRTEQDRKGVVEGLAAAEDERARTMASLVAATLPESKT
jgi:transcriptional regulator